MHSNDSLLSISSTNSTTSMGALTSNRKRGDNYFTPPLSNFDHISKKPRLMNQDHIFPRKSSLTTRFFKYPSPITPITRQIHAPCRPSRPNMGNFLVQQYDRARKTAVDSLRYFNNKDKQVIEIDGEDDDDDDSSVIQELENGGRRSGQKWDDGVVEVVDVPDGDDDGGGGGGGGVKVLDSSVSNEDDVNLKVVENAEKMMDLLCLSSSKFDDEESSSFSYVPVYKKLLGSAEKRNDSLKRLQFDIEYTEKLRETYRLLRPEKKEEHVEEDLITEPFVPLNEEDETEVSRALSNSNRRKVLVTHQNSNIDITGELLQCLRHGAWLNDEVINVYLELLKEREKREPKKFLKCHFFNTFFYKKLINGRGGYNYQSVKRWTSQRKLGYGLFECDKIFVPIHKEIHWCLAVINKKDEKFQYLDSLGGRDTQVLKVLARYFSDEAKDKNGKDIDVSSWKQEFVEDLPEQENGYDCGMFMLKYADFYSRDIGLCFSQDHMPYFRLRTAKEILRLKAE